MKPIGISTLLLCAGLAAFPANIHAADKKPGTAGRGKEPPSADQAREAIQAALKSAVEPAFDAAAKAKFKKGGVVVVPNQPTAVERRVASIVIEELDEVFPTAVKG